MRRHMDEVKGTEVKKTAKPVKRSAAPVKKPASPEKRTGVIWSTLDDMERWMEESIHRPFLFDFGLRPISRLLHDLRSESGLNPHVDMLMEGNEVVVKGELPGMKREDVTVSLVGNNLTISGEKKAEEKVERKDYLRLESSFGSFTRTVRLPEGCMSEKLTASFKDGVLEVRVPFAKREEAKTIKIE